MCANHSNRSPQLAEPPRATGVLQLADVSQPSTQSVQLANVYYWILTKVESLKAGPNFRHITGIHYACACCVKNSPSPSRVWTVASYHSRVSRLKGHPRPFCCGIPILLNESQGRAAAEYQFFSMNLRAEPQNTVLKAVPPNTIISRRLWSRYYQIMPLKRSITYFS